MSDNAPILRGRDSIGAIRVPSSLRR